MSAETQEMLDRFYWKHGPCCAGCDHWRALDGFIGECRKRAEQPLVESPKRRISAIHARTAMPISREVTARHHRCEVFMDGFPWQAMPLPYLERIGATERRKKAACRPLDAETYRSWKGHQYAKQLCAYRRDCVADGPGSRAGPPFAYRSHGSLSSRWFQAVREAMASLWRPGHSKLQSWEYWDST